MTCKRFGCNSNNPNFCIAYQKSLGQIYPECHPCKGCENRKSGNEEKSQVALQMRQGGRHKDVCPECGTPYKLWKVKKVCSKYH